jgi:hypothetical protein
MKMAGMESHPNKAMHTAETAKRIYLDLLSVKEKDLNFRLSRVSFDTINQGMTRQIV